MITDLTHTHAHNKNKHTLTHTHKQSHSSDRLFNRYLLRGNQDRMVRKGGLILDFKYKS
jgi:hypothetical protein